MRYFVITMFTGILMCGCHWGTCTTKYCPERINITVLLSDTQEYQSDDFILNWNTQNSGGGNAVFDNFNEEESSVSFFIEYTDYDITSELEVIEIEVLYSGNIIASAKTYDLEWETKVCNECEFPEDDEKATNGYVEIDATDF